MRCLIGLGLLAALASSLPTSNSPELAGHSIEAKRDQKQELRDHVLFPRKRKKPPPTPPASNITIILESSLDDKTYQWIFNQTYPDDQYVCANAPKGVTLDMSTQPGGKILEPPPAQEYDLPYNAHQMDIAGKLWDYSRGKLGDGPAGTIMSLGQASNCTGSGLVTYQWTACGNNKKRTYLATCHMTL